MSGARRHRIAAGVELYHHDDQERQHEKRDRRDHPEQEIMEPGDLLHHRGDGLLQTDLPRAGVADPSQRCTGGKNRHARDHECNQSSKHLHCRMRSLTKAGLARPLLPPPRVDARVNPARHGISPRAWRYCDAVGPGKSQSVKPQFGACRNAPYNWISSRKTACPQQSRTPHLRHVRPAWMAHRRTLLLDRTGRGMNEGSEIKCRGGMAIRLSHWWWAKELNDGHFRAWQTGSRATAGG